MTKKKESRHFNYIYKIVEESIRIAQNDCDSGFAAYCGLHTKEREAYREDLEKTYRSVRSGFKESCYGSDTKNDRLDMRKIGAVLCQAILLEKPFVFDENKASICFESIEHSSLSKNNNIRANTWAINNLFINYKVAYLTSVQLVYFSLMNELLKNADTLELGLLLNEKGCLYEYPVAGENDTNSDRFEVSMIIGLTRGDVYGKEMNLLLYAMQLYQLEMYTRVRLKIEKECRREKSHESNPITTPSHKNDSNLS